MAKKKPTGTSPSFEDIKKAIVLGLFSNDDLLEKLVLKGGNALSLVYAISTRASLDIDLSIPDEFENLELASSQISSGLQQSFDQLSLIVFDFTMSEEPRVISDILAGFWGGYKIYVYSPAMIVCEKLRAVCQQIDAYREKVQKHKAKRARDFLDIQQICEAEKISPKDNSFRSTLRKVFAVKDVPLNLLESLEQEREYHESDFVAVKATVANSTSLKEFEFYFKYTLDFISQLEAFWNK